MQKILTEARREFLRQIGRKGGATRAKAFTSKFQRAARAHVSHAACVANGRKGAAVLTANRAKRALAKSTAGLVVYGGTVSMSDEPGNAASAVQEFQADEVMR